MDGRNPSNCAGLTLYWPLQYGYTEAVTKSFVSPHLTRSLPLSFSPRIYKILFLLGNTHKKSNLYSSSPLPPPRLSNMHRQGLCVVLILGVLANVASSVTVDLFNSCNCIAARARFTNDDAPTTQNDWDPWTRYSILKASNSTTTVWHCELCVAPNAPHYPTESTSNCTEARAYYSSKWGLAQSVDPFQHWQTNAKTNYVYNWRHDLCKTTGDPTNLVCNCTAARQEYQARYNIVQDPWMNYINVPTRVWDCRLCNDTCSGRLSATTWAYGATPPNNQNAVIPNGCFISLSGSVAVKNLTVNGNLRCVQGQNISLTSGKIWVFGGFECGTFLGPFNAVKPFNGSFVVTLTGERPNTDTPTDLGGDKGLVAFAPGVIDLHGSVQYSWTRLSTTATAGAKTINVFEPVDWLAGDQIMITTTYGFFNYTVSLGDPMTSNEVRTIIRVWPNRTTISLDQPLAYPHLSKIYHYNSGKGLSGTIEKQAEVAVLTRRIKIQGDNLSDQGGFGGHVMVMPGARGYVSGVEFYRLGQAGILARYPWHWHWVGDWGSGQYIRNCSVHYTYQRCVTVHSTNYTVVANNTCFNFTGHGYFLEDGIEVGNTFYGNLGVQANTPLPQNLLTLGDGAPEFTGYFYPIPALGDGSRDAFGPSIFWISNPNNTFINNVAAAGNGTAFWYQSLLFNVTLDYWKVCNYTKEPRAPCPWPSPPWLAPFAGFDGNSAHSIFEGWTNCLDTTGAKGQVSYANHGAQVNNFKTYGTTIALWPCSGGVTFTNTTVLESVLGMQDPSDKVILNNVAFINYLDEKVPTTVEGIRLYDSGWWINNGLIMNYDDADQGFFVSSIGAGEKPYTRTSNMTVTNSPNLYFDIANQDESTTDQWSCVVLDLDGTLTGIGEEATLVPSTPIAWDYRCYDLKGATYGKICPSRYLQVMVNVNYSGKYLSLPLANITRYNFRALNHARPSILTGFAHGSNDYRWNLMTDAPYVYQLWAPRTNIIWITDISLSFSQSNFTGNSAALEIMNPTDVSVADGDKMWWQAPDCTSVYSSVLQSYFWDKVANRLCLRLTITSRILQTGWDYKINPSIYVMFQNTTKQILGFYSTLGGYTLTPNQYPPMDYALLAHLRHFQNNTKY